MTKSLITNTCSSKYSCLDKDAIYFFKEEPDMRPPFFHDADRIIYSLAFSRYLDKTQVFTFQKHDHITKRMTHVIYVSKIARTIGRALGLNEDLIEAAALGHDLGHTPFGHVGEKILSEISRENNEGYFNHNIHSVRLLKDIENYGNGLNISLQVLDAIMCHNGEFALEKYEPIIKSKEKFLEEYAASYKDEATIKSLKPMTLEGCVVRISDLIAYLGRDIEDAIRLKIISLDDIPSDIKEVLGVKNREIITTIINDIVLNSKDKPYLKISEEVFKAIVKLKKFNYENIYNKAYTLEELEKIKVMFNTLFTHYVNDLKNNNENSVITKYYQVMSDRYKENTFERIAIDYIAGMTDEFALKEYNKIKKNNHNRKEVEKNDI